MKTIVTHLSPDLDAIASIWLIRRFLPGWSNTKLHFVPAGTTLDCASPDDNPDIIHVDTGLGKFDHHQTDELTCAAKKVLRLVKKEGRIKKSFQEPLSRIVETVNFFDHFHEVFLDEADSDVYDFLVVSVLDGLRIKFQDDSKLVEMGEKILDGLLQTFVNKTRAEEEIKKGLVFNSRWGKSIALNSENEETLKLALKKGYWLVVRKGPRKGHLRIKGLPVKKINLKKLYLTLKEKDKKASWFFHPSGHMVLNGSVKNPKTVPTTLTLNQVVKIIKNIK